MYTTDQSQQQKSLTWVWIVVGVILLCFCCVLIAAGVGLYEYLQRTQSLPFQKPAIEPTMAVPSAPTEMPLMPSPANIPPLTIKSFDPRQSNYPTLPSLAERWEPALMPSSRTWNINLRSTQPVIILMGWCTTTKSILNQNYQFITWLLDVNGESIPLSNLYAYDQDRSDMVCRSYSGIVRQWPVSEHRITITMRLHQDINDGWDTYPAGDYTDVYVINVTQ